MDFNKKKVIKEAQAGDMDSFSMLVDEYKDKIYGIALTLSGNKMEAEEVAQQIFIKLWKKIEKFNFRSAFSTWLYRLAHNTFYDYVRKKKRRSDRKIPSEKIYNLNIEDTVYKNVAEKEIKSAVYEALEDIPEEFRMVVIYYDLHGKSYKDISDIIDIPLGTVKSRLYRGREMLKQKLGNIFGALNV
ncbi:MAG: sigma-70 family RNA polymerase sigma factor [Elusimicrobiota bacterium]